VQPATRWTAVEGVNWLRGQDRRLGDLTQSHVDAWVVLHPSHRPMLRSFLLWLQARGEISDRLRLDGVTSRDDRRVLEDDVRTELVRRCLYDTALDVGTRLAGCLVLALRAATDSHCEADDQVGHRR
jgi:hypothetical protein